MANPFLGKVCVYEFLCVINASLLTTKPISYVPFHEMMADSWESWIQGKSCCPKYVCIYIYMIYAFIIYIYIYIKNCIDVGPGRVRFRKLPLLKTLSQHHSSKHPLSTSRCSLQIFWDSSIKAWAVFWGREVPHLMETSFLDILKWLLSP